MVIGSGGRAEAGELEREGNSSKGDGGFGYVKGAAETLSSFDVI